MVFKKGFLVVSIFIGLFYLFAQCNRLKSSDYRKKKQDSLETKEFTINAKIEYSDSGILRAKICSPLMVGVKNIREPFIEMPKGVKVDFFDINGVVASFLRAEYAKSITDKKKIVVRNNVEVMNSKGEKLETEELYWDQNSEKIYTDKSVRIITQDQIIQGDGMEADQTFSSWEIKRYRGKIQINNNDSISRNKSVVAGRRRDICN